MCDELVKRLIKVAGEVDNDYDVDPYNAEQRCLAILEAADVIEELSQLNAEITKRELKLRMRKPRWIPVTERLPDEYTTILFVSSSGQVHVGYYDSEHKGFCDMTGFRYVCTHWMLAPEPPKEG